MIERLSKIVATNLDELKLKARFVEKGDVDDCLAESIVRDLLALDRKPKIAESNARVAIGE